MHPACIIARFFLAISPWPELAVHLDVASHQAIAIDAYGRTYRLSGAKPAVRPVENQPISIIRKENGEWHAVSGVPDCILRYHGDHEEMHFWPVLYEVNGARIYQGRKKVLLLSSSGAELDHHDVQDFECAIDPVNSRIILIRFSETIDVRNLSVSKGRFCEERLSFPNKKSHRSLLSRIVPAPWGAHYLVTILVPKYGGALPRFDLADKENRDLDAVDTGMWCRVDLRTGDVLPLFVANMRYLSDPEVPLRPWHLMTVFGGARPKLGVAEREFYQFNLDALIKLAVSRPGRSH